MSLLLLLRLFVAPAEVDLLDTTVKQFAKLPNEIEPAFIPCGVNRRTMILFSKKAKQRRLSAIQLAAGKDSLQALLPESAEVDAELEMSCNSVKIPPQDFQTSVKTSNLCFLVANGVLQRSPAKRKHAIKRIRAPRNSKQYDSVELMDSKLRSRRTVEADEIKLNSESLVKGEPVVSDNVPRPMAVDARILRGTAGPASPDNAINPVEGAALPYDTRHPAGEAAVPTAAHDPKNLARGTALHTAPADAREAAVPTVPDDVRNSVQRAAGPEPMVLESRHQVRGSTGITTTDGSRNTVRGTAGLI